MEKQAWRLDIRSLPLILWGPSWATKNLLLLSYIFILILDKFSITFLVKIQLSYYCFPMYIFSQNGFCP